jgi:hypothetical protein
LCLSVALLSGDASFCVSTSLKLACYLSSKTDDCTCQCTVGPTPGLGGLAAGAKVVTLAAAAYGPVCIHGAACSGQSTATATTGLGFANCGGIAANCVAASGATCATTTAYADVIKADAVCTCNCYTV